MSISLSVSPNGPRCRQISAATGPKQPTPNLAELSRTDLALILAQQCDRDNDGFLNVNEMQEFALRSGGSPYSYTGWVTEYSNMASELQFQKEVGMPIHRAARLLDDTSKAGAYMPTEQLLNAVGQIREDREYERRLRRTCPAEPLSGATRLVVMNSVAKLMWSHIVVGRPLSQHHAP